MKQEWKVNAHIKYTFHWKKEVENIHTITKGSRHQQLSMGLLNELWVNE